MCGEGWLSSCPFALSRSSGGSLCPVRNFRMAPELPASFCAVGALSWRVCPASRRLQDRLSGRSCFFHDDLLNERVSSPGTLSNSLVLPVSTAQLWNKAVAAMIKSCAPIIFPCLASIANNPACTLATSVVKSKTGILAKMDSTKAERRAFLASLSA